jgi:hypothetical protein
LSLGAAGYVKLAYAAQSRVRGARGYTGSEAARAILAANGLHEVSVEPVDGFLTDHYDPSAKVLRLSSANFHGQSLAAIGVAAHEAGHAIQHASSYAPMAIRSGLVPIANIGSQLGFLVIFLGFGMNALGLVKIGILLYACLLLFQLVTLPVEFNASSRAKRALAETGIVEDRSELAGVSSVLTAAGPHLRGRGRDDGALDPLLHAPGGTDRRAEGRLVLQR